MKYVIIWLDDPLKVTTPRFETAPNGDRMFAREEEDALTLAETLGGIIAPFDVVRAVWAKVIAKELTISANPNDRRRALFQVRR